MAFLDNMGVAKLCALIKEKYDNLKSLIAGKQDALTAGTNISINNGVISAVDTNTTYTAGTGINIDANNEISCTISSGSDSTPKYCSFTLPMLIAKNLQNTNNTWWVDQSGSFISSESGLPDLTLSELTTQLKNQGFAIVWCQNNNTSIDMTTIGTEYGLSYISGPNTAGGISSAYNFSAGFHLFYISNKTLFFVKTPAQLRTDWGSYIPAAPSSDGTYLLKCSVSSGTPTYSWESITTGGSY